MTLVGSCSFGPPWYRGREGFLNTYCIDILLLAFPSSDSLRKQDLAVLAMVRYNSFKTSLYQCTDSMSDKQNSTRL